MSTHNGFSVAKREFAPTKPKGWDSVLLPHTDELSRQFDANETTGEWKQLLKLQPKTALVTAFAIGLTIGWLVKR